MIMKSVLLLVISFLCLTAEASPPDRYMVKLPNCRYRCGNVVIPFPFGIGKSCYLNEWYSVNCSTNTSSGAAKSFLNHPKLNVELLNVSLDHQTVTVNSPIASHDQQEMGSSESQPSINLDQSPFLFSSLHNIFVVLGCVHAQLMDHGNILSGCTSVCNHSYTSRGCYGINCCKTTILSTKSYYLNNYRVSFIGDGEGNDPTSTAHAFLVDGDWFSRNFIKPEDVTGVKYAPLSLFWMIKKKTSTILLIVAAANSTTPRWDLILVIILVAAVPATKAILTFLMDVILLENAPTAGGDVIAVTITAVAKITGVATQRTNQKL